MFSRLVILTQCYALMSSYVSTNLYGFLSEVLVKSGLQVWLKADHQTLVLQVLV